ALCFRFLLIPHLILLGTTHPMRFSRRSVTIPVPCSCLQRLHARLRGAMNPTPAGRARQPKNRPEGRPLQRPERGIGETQERRGLQKAAGAKGAQLCKAQGRDTQRPRRSDSCPFLYSLRADRLVTL